MIKDLAGTAQYIADWIKERARIAHATTLVVGVSGGVDSALVIALCKQTGVHTVGVMMPCHSSSHSLDRGKELLEKFWVPSHTVVLDEAHRTIAGQICGEIPADHSLGLSAISREAQGALRSCLRAPTLDYVGKVYNGIIVGTGNRDEDEVTRYFQKRGDGCVDISPIAGLHKSEVYQLAKFLGVPSSILDATPTADLWGPDSGQTDEGQLGITYPEVEWGIRLADKFGGTRKEHFYSALDNAGYNDATGPDLTDRQFHVLKTLGQMEAASRHKENPGLPVCPIRTQTQLVE